MKKYLMIFCALMISWTGFSQDLKIGVRIGASFYKLQGELEANESQFLAPGFSFGITGQYNFSESFGVRTELSFLQRSSRQEYNGRFLTVLKPDPLILSTIQESVAIYGEGDSKFNITKNFSSFTIPLYAVYRPLRKFEIFGGVEIDFVAGASGRGSMTFISNEFDKEIRYEQTLNYNYTNDNTGEFTANATDNNILIDFDANMDGEQEQVTIAKSIPAYYYFQFDQDGSYKPFKTFDMALSGGMSYYINPGLYIRAVFSYGLRDATNTDFDYSLQDINNDASFIFRDDYDRKIGGQISIGFQF